MYEDSGWERIQGILRCVCSQYLNNISKGLALFFELLFVLRLCSFDNTILG